MMWENPAACQRCLDEMGNFRKRREQFDEREVLQFLEKLALGSIMGLLSPAEKELARASRLFSLPVPEPVIDRLAKAGALSSDFGDPARLSALGIWNVFEHPFRTGVSAVAINPLFRLYAGALTEDEETALARLIASDLFDEWGGPERSRRRGGRHDLELTRLALLAGQDEVLLYTAEYAVRWLAEQFEYRQAAEMGEAAIACIEQAGRAVPLGLRGATADSAERVGKVQPALDQLEGALQDIERMTRGGRPVDPHNHASLLTAHARLSLEVGRADDALPEFEQARGLVKTERERATLLGDIARLLAAKGELDEALKLYRESLAAFEPLGDKRELAMTLGDIARLLVAKGEVDEALELHRERRAIFQSLGKKRARAIRLGDAARLLTAKADLDQALRLHREELAIYEAEGDPEGIANTLWSIARTKLRQQHSRRALEHLAASYTVCLKLGNLLAVCHMGIEFGKLLCAFGRRAEGLDVFERSRDGFVKLGRPSDVRYVQSVINDIQSNYATG